MLTRTTNNKQEIQQIPFLTTSFVPPHYQHRIQMEEVTQKWMNSPPNSILSSAIVYVGA